MFIFSKFVVFLVTKILVNHGMVVDSVCQKRKQENEVFKTCLFSQFEHRYIVVVIKPVFAVIEIRFQEIRTLQIVRRSVGLHSDKL